MKGTLRLKRKAHMTIILLAGRITKVCGLVLYIIVGLTVGDVA
jgi:hypothetical protein